MSDGSGNSKDGVYSNVTLQQTGPQPAAFPGFAANNTAVSLNGTNSNVQVTALSLGSDYTFETWFCETGSNDLWAQYLGGRGTSAAGWDSIGIRQSDMHSSCLTA